MDEANIILRLCLSSLHLGFGRVYEVAGTGAMLGRHQKPATLDWQSVQAGAQSAVGQGTLPLPRYDRRGGGGV